MIYLSQRTAEFCALQQAPAVIRDAGGDDSAVTVNHSFVLPDRCDNNREAPTVSSPDVWVLRAT